jgi:cytochrome c-type biogenesis protein CcmH/NrfF
MDDRMPDDPAGRVDCLERKLLAPCCHRHSLEDHRSDVARRLRSEIRCRTVLGEPPWQIEGDLVRRYGDAIRRVPSGEFAGAPPLERPRCR